MSDSVDDPPAAFRHLVNESKTQPLRQQMREFVSVHGSTADLKTLRDDVTEGDDLSDVVTSGREERV